MSATLRDTGDTAFGAPRASGASRRAARGGFGADGDPDHVDPARDGSIDADADADADAEAEAEADAANDPLVAARDGPLRRADDAGLAALIERIVGHDQRAFEAFYDATCHRVIALLRRFLRDPARLEEVAEDVFFQVWRDAPRFDAARGQPMAWLLTIARSRALDALRRAEREAVELGVDDDELEASMAPDASADPAHRLAESRRADALRAALAALDPQPRQLVSLAFLRGLTHEEVAAETGLPLGTVKSSIRRALGVLRAALGPDLSPDPAS